MTTFRRCAFALRPDGDRVLAALDPNTMVTAVVLHYRNWPGVAVTIESLRRQSVSVSVLLVDNASGDGSVNESRAAFPDLKSVEADKNRGYAAGMNLGLKHSEPGDALLLTHEVVLASDAVEQLQKELKAKVGLVGPLLFYRSKQDVVFSAGGFVGSGGLVGHLTDVPTGPQDADWLDGACLLASAELFESVGPIDEGYFMYFEEVDLAARARRAGWRVRCVPAAHAWQEPGRLPLALFTRNWLRFLSRNCGSRSVRSGIATTARRVATAILQRRPRRALLLTWGVLSFVFRLPPRVLLPCSRIARRP